ncbi:hypothetical protein V493_00968 [Pseudogymnoascus sp. VKM F-4281 (FW-2241)]|nr:hypothetical protein V493_00968 [Pseudogymnoascus sp. VKM F-4281 (FW-2241)]
MQLTSLLAATILSLTTTTIATPITQRDYPDISLSAKLALADTSADRIALLPDDSSFLFNFDVNRGKGGLGGDITLANRKTFPALVGTQSSMAVGFLGPCGFNTPHVHLRGTELQVVTQGTIHTEMIVENGVFTTAGDAKSGRRLIKNDLSANQMTVFYQGSVHTQFNTGCNPATFVASFNSEDPGTGQVAEELFALSEDVVIAAFGQAVDGAQVDDFKGKIPASIAKGVEQCLMDCLASVREIVITYVAAVRRKFMHDRHRDRDLEFWFSVKRPPRPTIAISLTSSVCKATAVGNSLPLGEMIIIGNSLPLGEMATELTESEWLSSVWSSAPVATSPEPHCVIPRARDNLLAIK